jgi:hypothetical protein
LEQAPSETPKPTKTQMIAAPRKLRRDRTHWPRRDQAPLCEILSDFSIDR